eukprot:2058794-Amphidinium_carterae.1
MLLSYIKIRGDSGFVVGILDISAPSAACVHCFHDSLAFSMLGLGGYAQASLIYLRIEERLPKHVCSQVQGSTPDQHHPEIFPL